MCKIYVQTITIPGPEDIKLLSCSAQLRLKFILLINVKMPTTVGILTFRSRINNRLWSPKCDISIYLGYFSIYEQFEFHAQLCTVEHENISIILEPGPKTIILQQTKKLTGVFANISELTVVQYPYLQELDGSHAQHPDWLDRSSPQLEAW